MIKPFAPSINLGNKITERLLIDVPLFERGGTICHDIAGKRILSFAGTPTWKQGIIGAGVACNGTTDGITSPTSQTITNQTDNWTAEVWWSATATTTEAVMLNLTNVNDSAMYSIEVMSGTIQVLMNGLIRVNSTFSPTLGSLYQTVMRRSQGTTNLFINGAKNASVSFGTAPNGNASNFNIGASRSNGSTLFRFFPGTVYFGRHWTRPLADKEIRSLYENPWQIYLKPRIQYLFSVPNNIVATGGVITQDGNYKVHTFNSSGTFQVTSGSGPAEVLTVAGGGAGGGQVGSDGGGGGGAGGLVHHSAYAVSVNSYTVTIGNGGTGGAGTGGSGQNSVFDTITALGGGGGAVGNAASQVSGANGGSGGGGNGDNAGSPNGGSATQGNSGGGTGYGNNGGSGQVGAGFSPPGGGGGAGAVGQNGALGGSPNNKGGDGGNGNAWTISGSSIYYAGGGGGGYSNGGAGGLGGGGAGDTFGTGSGAAGATNAGGGGGGSSASGATNGYNGGSGIVIVRYFSPATNVFTSFLTLLGIG